MRSPIPEIVRQPVFRAARRSVCLLALAHGCGSDPGSDAGSAVDATVMSRDTTVPGEVDANALAADALAPDTSTPSPTGQGAVTLLHYSLPSFEAGAHTLTASFSESHAVSCDRPVLAERGVCARVGACSVGTETLSAPEVGTIRVRSGDTVALEAVGTLSVSAPGEPPPGPLLIELLGGTRVSPGSATASLPSPLSVEFPTRIDDAAPLTLTWTPTTAAGFEILIGTPGSAERVRCTPEASAGSVVVDPGLFTPGLFGATVTVDFAASNRTTIVDERFEIAVALLRSRLEQGIPVD